MWLLVYGTDWSSTDTEPIFCAQEAEFNSCATSKEGSFQCVFLGEAKEQKKNKGSISAVSAFWLSEMSPFFPEKGYECILHIFQPLLLPILLTQLTFPLQLATFHHLSHLLTHDVYCLFSKFIIFYLPSLQSFLKATDFQNVPSFIKEYYL